MLIRQLRSWCGTEYIAAGGEGGDDPGDDDAGHKESPGRSIPDARPVSTKESPDSPRRLHSIH